MTSGAKTAKACNEWEGQIVDVIFPLLAYLGGTIQSAVFLTERPDGDPRRAAIKLIPADDVTAEALLARWKAAAQLSHPDLLQLFEMGRGSLGGVAFAYVVMEYAEENLGQVDRPLTASEAADMLDGVLKALFYLHGKQLAHGHLKPSNILAVGDQLKVSSDMIRPVSEWRSDLDLPGPCDPPEIAREGASPAGDVWSVGVTLVEAFTKQPPARPGTEVAASSLESIPAPFRTVASNCLRTDPLERWTIAGIRKSLEPPPQGPVRSPDAPSRGRLTPKHYLLAAAVVALALAATTLIWRLTSDRAPGALPPALPQESKSGPVRSEPQPQDVQPEAAAPKPAIHSAGNSAGQGIRTQILPDVPAKARNTIHGKVAINIRVRVDGNGSVADAHNESPDSSRYFGNLALQAARRWKFEPAEAGASAHPAEWNLHFQFVRDARRPVSVKADPAH
jgi:TonB family protein